jgi:hypothetical protein
MVKRLVALQRGANRARYMFNGWTKPLPGGGKSWCNGFAWIGDVGHLLFLSFR